MSGRDELITGGRQLNDLLQTLAPKLRKNILRSALAAGATVFKKAALREVPRVSGDLARSIRVSSRIDNKRNRVTASVKAGGKKAPHGISVEFGTRPHVIEAPRGQSLLFRGQQYTEVNHPGAEKKPFMRPAADRAFTEGVAAVKNKIRERLTAQGINTPAPVMDDPE